MEIYFFFLRDFMGEGEVLLPRPPIVSVPALHGIVFFILFLFVKP